MAIFFLSMWKSGNVNNINTLWELIIVYVRKLQTVNGSHLLLSSLPNVITEMERLRSCSAFYLNVLGAISEITTIAFLLSLLTQRIWVKVWHLSDCVDAQAIYPIILIISSDESWFFFAWFIEFTSKNLLRGYSVIKLFKKYYKKIFMPINTFCYSTSHPKFTHYNLVLNDFFSGLHYILRINRQIYK